MSIDRKEYKARTPLVLQQVPRAPDPALARAAILMEKATHSPEWNFYLEVIQARIETAKEAEKKIMDQFFSSPEFKYEELVSLKVQGMLARERISTLEEILSVPGDIIKKDHDQ